MSHTVRVKYIGAALPLATTTVILFDSTVSFTHGGQMQALGFERILIDLVCSNDGTMRWYKSRDHGTTWFQTGSQAITGASGTEATGAPVDILIEGYLDCKVDFVVGASNETVFEPDISLTSDRAQG